MRIHGTLTKWNDDRGFGFITPAKGPPEIFVHVSEFPREGGRPTVNELISFEVVPGRDGKQRAVRIMRPGQKSRAPAAMRAPTQSRSGWFPRTLALLVVAAVGALGYSQYLKWFGPAEDSMPEEPVHLAPLPPDQIPPEPLELPPPEVRAIPAEVVPIAPPVSRYACDGRTMCSQMHSCEEATYFIRNCPNTKMDGNHDGVPCESQWCR